MAGSSDTPRGYQDLPAGLKGFMARRSYLLYPNNQCILIILLGTHLSLLPQSYRHVLNIGLVPCLPRVVLLKLPARVDFDLGLCMNTLSSLCAQSMVSCLFFGVL